MQELLFCVGIYTVLTNLAGKRYPSIIDHDQVEQLK